MEPLPAPNNAAGAGQTGQALPQEDSAGGITDMSNSGRRGRLTYLSTTVWRHHATSPFWRRHAPR